MDYSFGLLKPDCLKRGLTNTVMTEIEKSGLEVVAFRQVMLTERDVEIIWSPCVGQSFYPQMLRFSLSGECGVFLVKGHNAIKALNELVGFYDPEQGGPSIRRRFGTSKMENVIHSTSDMKTRLLETALFFRVSNSFVPMN